MKDNITDGLIASGVVSISMFHVYVDKLLATAGLAGGVALVAIRIALVIREWRRGQK